MASILGKPRRPSSTAAAASALFIFSVAGALGCKAPVYEGDPLPTTREGLEAAIEEDRERLEELVIQARPTSEEDQPIAADPELMAIGTRLTALHTALDELDEESKELQ